eukprot:932118_1
MPNPGQPEVAGSATEKPKRKKPETPEEKEEFRLKKRKHDSIRIRRRKMEQILGIPRTSLTPFDPDAITESDIGQIATDSGLDPAKIKVKFRNMGYVNGYKGSKRVRMNGDGAQYNEANQGFPNPNNYWQQGPGSFNPYPGHYPGPNRQFSGPNRQFSGPNRQNSEPNRPYRGPDGTGIGPDGQPLPFCGKKTPQERRAKAASEKRRRARRLREQNEGLPVGSLGLKANEEHIKAMDALRSKREAEEGGGGGQPAVDRSAPKSGHPAADRSGPKSGHPAVERSAPKRSQPAAERSAPKRGRPDSQNAAGRGRGRGNRGRRRGWSQNQSVPAALQCQSTSFFGYGGQPTGYGSQSAGYGGQSTGYGGQSAGYGGQSSGYGGQPGGYGGQSAGRGGQSAAGRGSQPGGYGRQSRGRGGQSVGSGQPVVNHKAKFEKKFRQLEIEQSMGLDPGFLDDVDFDDPQKLRSFLDEKRRKLEMLQNSLLG